MVRRLALAVALALSGGAEAASIFVNDGSTAGDVTLDGCAGMGVGADTPGCGTCAAPCATPQYAYDNAVVAGDVVWLNAGRYLPGATGPIVALANPAKSPIAFRGARDSAGALLAVLDADQRAEAGVLVQVSDVILDGLVIANGGTTSSVLEGSGVYVDYLPLTGIVITDLEITGMVCPIGTPISFASTADPCTGCLIEGCRLHDNSDCGAGIWTVSPSQLAIRKNAIWGNSATDASLSAIVLHAAKNVVVEGNLIHDNGGPAIKVSDCSYSQICASRPSVDVTIRGNTLWNNETAATSNRATGEIILENGVTGAALLDNVVGATKKACVAIDRTTPNPVTSDYNLFFPAAGVAVVLTANTDQTLPLWQAASGLDLGSVNADPLFVSTAPSYDFHLQSPSGYLDESGALRCGAWGTSPAIDLDATPSAAMAEPQPSGLRLNSGAYGGTGGASMSPLTVTGLAVQGSADPPGTAVEVAVQVAYAATLPRLLEPGLSVRFNAVSGGGTIDPGQVPLDSSGEARATAVLGPPGPQVFRAEVVGICSTGFDFHLAANLPDAGAPDAGEPDAGPADAGMLDAGGPDAGLADAGMPDAGEPDAGAPDAGSQDGGVANVGDALPSGADGDAATAGWDPEGSIRLTMGACSCSGGAGDLAPGLVLLGLGALVARSRGRASV